MPSLSPRSLLEYTLISIAAYIFVLAPLQSILIPLSWQEYIFSSSDSNASHNHTISLANLILPPDNLSCPPHTYTTTLLSRSPLIIYIHGFLPPTEAAHLLALSNPHWTPSPVYAHGSEPTIDQTIRNSSRAALPATDATVACLARRALDFQGRPADTFVEQLWTQRYDAPGGHYAHHFDWAGDLRARRAGRVSTFMVYVACDGCVGGGTTFPRLTGPVGADAEKAWCNFVECEGKDAGGQQEEGITFKPIPGNAIYWENFRPDGRGWEELWHAADPLREGIKVGLNIWSWFQDGYGGVYKREQERQSLQNEEKTEL
jgi:prolyl 4-hydroxylase